MFQSLDCSETDESTIVSQTSQVEIQVTDSSTSSSESHSSTEYIPESTITELSSHSTIDNKPVRPVVSFNGRMVAPIVRNNFNSEFPSLGYVPTKQEQINSSLSLKKPRANTFIVATSYNSERKWTKTTQRDGPESARTSAFVLMDNKEDVAKKLTCTRACNNVSRKEDGNYGVCYRAVCSFAHSLAELTDPMCGFDGTCRFMYGRKRQDGSIDSNGKCAFRHSNENHDGWIKRTGRTVPDLPETSEETRKIQVVESVVTENPVVEIQSENSITESIVIENPVIDNTFQPVESVVIETTRARRKNRWDEKPKNLENEQVSCIVPEEIVEKSHRLSHHSDHKHRTHRSSSRKYENDDSQVIHVPTHELAEIAIKAAFDRGVFNLRVIVD
jgi:hypothetical protein